MAIEITDGTQTIAVRMILGWNTTSPSLNIFTQPIGRRDYNANLRGVGLREGSFSVLCSTLAEAVALEKFLKTKNLFTLTDTDAPEIDLTFATYGSIGVALDSDTRTLATVDVGYREMLS